MEPKKKSPIQELWPYAFIIASFFFLFTGDAEKIALGLIVFLIGVGGTLIRFMPKHHAKRAAQQQDLANTAAVAARQAEEKRLTEQREREYQQQDAVINETTLFQQLHSQVNELLDLASRIKRDGDNKVALQAMMEVVGSIAAQRDFKPRHFADDGISADITLVLQQLEKAGLQDEIVYQRAQRVLKPLPERKVRDSVPPGYIP